MSIILVRHGTTALNLARVLQPPDTPLNADGRAQAEAVAGEMLALRPAGIISSDLPRARQTAEAIARATGLDLETTDLLQERNFGELRGQAYDQLGFDPLTMAQAPAGGESATAFERRVGLAFALAVRRRESIAGPLVVVTHGLVIGALLAGPINVAADRLAGMHIANTSVTILGEQPPHSVLLLNSTRHLNSGMVDNARGLVGG